MKGNLIVSIVSQREQNIIWMVVRQVAYTTCLVLITMFLWKLGAWYHEVIFNEGGLVENIQCVVLAVAMLLFGWCAVLYKNWRPLLVAFGSLCLFALCREQDAFLDAHIPLISWKFCFVFPMAATCYMGLRFKGLKKYLFSFFEMPAFHLMMAAMIVIIPVSECIGHKPMIAAVLGGDDFGLGKPIRRMIEEGGELLGYFLVLFAAIELILNIRSYKNLRKS